MAFKVGLNAIWLSREDSPWHVVTMGIEKFNLKDYLIIDNMVLHITPGIATLTPIRRFKHKNLLPEMRRITVGSRLQDNLIAFDLLEGRKSIQEVLDLAL